MPSATIHGKTIHYSDTGSGFPLLLGHSYLFDYKMWEPQIRALERQYRVIAVDLWGHGQSDSLPAGCDSLVDIAADHLALMDRLAIKIFGVVGLSVGGMWGAELAAMEPKRVQSLVLMDTYVGAEPEVSKAKYYALMDAVEASGAISEPIAQQVVPLFFSNDPAPALVAALTEYLLSLTPEQCRQSIVPLGRIIFGRPDRLEILDRIKAQATPSLVVVGAEDKSRPPHEAEAMAVRLDCGCTIIPRAGHISTLENPEDVNMALIAFHEQAIRPRH